MNISGGGQMWEGKSPPKRVSIPIIEYGGKGYPTSSRTRVRDESLVFLNKSYGRCSHSYQIMPMFTSANQMLVAWEYMSTICP